MTPSATRFALIPHQEQTRRAAEISRVGLHLLSLIGYGADADVYRWLAG